MTWFSDIAEGVGSFWSDNKDWIQPVVKAGVGALKQSNTDNSQSQYMQYLQEREKANYQKSVDEINAYNQMLMSGALGGSGGGGGGGNSAASAAAARQTEANRRKAAKKANKYLQANYKDLLAMYQPYRQTADQLLPQMTKTYEDSLGLQKSMLGFVQSPQEVAKLNGSIPAWNVQVPLPDYVKGK